MADSKKYNGSTWQHSLRKLGTSTDTLTSLPADIYADGNNATVGLKGNMEQTGTPTPTTPIQPSECGDKTANLLDISLITSNSGITNNGDGTLTVSGYPVNADQTLSEMCPDLKVGDTVYLKFNTTGLNAVYMRYYESSALKWSDTWYTNSTRTMTEEFLNARVGFYKQSSAQGGGNAIISNLMICTESSATYQPYGYKIPISSASTTTPVYLGEVETTRKIYKYEFTGQETSWKTTGGFFYNDSIQPDYIRILATNILMCSHYKAQRSVGQGSEVNDKSCAFYGYASVQRLYFKDSSFSTLTDFTTYLQQQYSNGTPVTAWYVLAEPTTGIVNEPLRKIGDYADTVSGITIPTIAGADSFDVLTTLKPSEVSLAYTGWHDASVKEWDGSEWD